MAMSALTGCAIAAPVVTLHDAVTDLDDIGLYRIGYALRGQAEHDFAIGWTGLSDESTGVTYMPQGILDGRRALLLHPPWRTGPGVTYQEFSLQLPKCSRALLRGAVALREEAVDESDGATFRVLCDGRKLLDIHSKDARWRDFEFDLTESAGKTVTIRYETDPGPADNVTWDHALWGGRQLVLEGVKAKPHNRKDPPPLDLRRLRSAQGAGVVPPSGFEGKREVGVQGDTAVFRYIGADGTLEYRWTKPTSGDPLFGRIELVAKNAGGKSVLPVSSTSMLPGKALSASPRSSAGIGTRQKTGRSV